MHLITFLALGLAQFSLGLDLRIVGGRDAKLDEFPYQVSIRYQGQHHCGGMVIAEDLVLTAAHCFDYVGLNDDLIVVAGGINLIRNEGVEQEAQIEQIVIHEDYISAYFQNDICLLKVFPPFRLNSHVQAVSLPDPMEETSPGVMTVVTGWGYLSVSRFVGLSF